MVGVHSGVYSFTFWRNRLENNYTPFLCFTDAAGENADGRLSYRVFGMLNVPDNHNTS